jgi:hypothetical protein
MEGLSKLPRDTVSHHTDDRIAVNDLIRDILDFAEFLEKPMFVSTTQQL